MYDTSACSACYHRACDHRACDHSACDHSACDHSACDHSACDHSACDHHAVMPSAWPNESSGSWTGTSFRPKSSTHSLEKRFEKTFRAIKSAFVKKGHCFILRLRSGTHAIPRDACYLGVRTGCAIFGQRIDASRRTENEKMHISYNKWCRCAIS